MRKKKLAKIIGKTIEIINPSHPWYREKGKAKEFEEQLRGLALVVELDNNLSCSITSFDDIKILN